MKKKEKPNKIQQDVIIQTLKKRYFEIVLKENYPNTPDITKEVDNLQEAIFKLQSEKETSN